MSKQDTDFPILPIHLATFDSFESDAREQVVQKVTIKADEFPDVEDQINDAAVAYEETYFRKPKYIMLPWRAYLYLRVLFLERYQLSPSITGSGLGRLTSYRDMILLPMPSGTPIRALGETDHEWSRCAREEEKTG